MRKIRKALLGILTMMSGAILAVPTEATERYIPGVFFYNARPERAFSYPYGGSYLRVELIVHGRRWTSEIENFVDLDIAWKTDVVAHHFEQRVREQMLHVASGPGVEIIHTHCVGTGAVGGT